MGKKISIIVYLCMLPYLATDLNAASTAANIVANPGRFTTIAGHAKKLWPFVGGVSGGLVGASGGLAAGQYLRGENIYPDIDLSTPMPSQPPVSFSSITAPFSPSVGAAPAVDVSDLLNRAWTAGKTGTGYYKSLLQGTGEQIGGLGTYLAKQVGISRTQSLYDYLREHPTTRGISMALSPASEYWLVKDYFSPSIKQAAAIAAGAGAFELGSKLLYDHVIKLWYSGEIDQLKHDAKNLLAGDPGTTFSTFVASGQTININMPRIYKAKAFFLALAEAINEETDGTTINRLISNAISTYNNLPSIKYTKYLNLHRPYTLISDLRNWWLGTTPVHKLAQAINEPNVQAKKSTAIEAINDIANSMLNSAIAAALHLTGIDIY